MAVRDVRQALDEGEGEAVGDGIVQVTIRAGLAQVTVTAGNNSIVVRNEKLHNAEEFVSGDEVEEFGNSRVTVLSQINEA